MILSRHFAFLVSEPEFDAIFARIQQQGLAYWADPARTRKGEINHHDGGRGVYFEDPNGIVLEITSPPTSPDLAHNERAVIRALKWIKEQG